MVYGCMNAIGAALNGPQGTNHLVPVQIKNVGLHIGIKRGNDDSRIS